MCWIKRKKECRNKKGGKKHNKIAHCAGHLFLAWLMGG